MGKVVAAAAVRPEYVRSFAGKTMFQIVLCAYDPSEAISYVRAVQFDLTPSFGVEVKLSADYRFRNIDRPDYPHFGDTANFTRHVMLGAGKRYLPPSLEAFHSIKEVADVAQDQAADIAINLIEAAKSASDFSPDLQSIGGRVEAYSLSQSGVQKLR